MQRVSIIVPVYYNEGSLGLLFEELLKVEAQLAQRQCTAEIIFVDDGSGDQSLARLLAIKETHPQITIVKLTRNFGAVRASKAGLEFVTGDCFLWLSADLQDDPSLIPSMVDRWLGGSKFVVYAREKRDDSWLTKIYAQLYYVLLRTLVVRDYPRGGYDLALMDKVFLPHLKSSGKNLNVTLLAFWLGFQPDVMYYTRQKRQHGRSRWTFAKKFNYFLDSFLGFSYIPLRILTTIGVITSILSISYGVYITLFAVLGIRDAPGFATLVALVTFLQGLIIIMLGLVGEYIWRIYDDINGTPEVVIDEVY